jgi:hypothetical protein
MALLYLLKLDWKVLAGLIAKIDREVATANA